MKIKPKPFSIAKIFLSHSWKDNDISDKIYKKIHKKFKVFYDRADIINKNSLLTINASDAPIQREEIVDSDIFIFLVSKSSLDKYSYAYKEFHIADNLPGSIAPKLILIVTPNTIMPNYLLNQIYIDYENDNSINKISKEIENNLINIGGFKNIKIDEKKMIYGGDNTASILNDLLITGHKGVYKINSIIQYNEINNIANEINNLKVTEKNKIIDKLIFIYINNHHLNEYIIARQNAIIVTSKIIQNNSNIVNEFKKRVPDYSTPFLFRGFHVALGILGSDSIIIDYVNGLAFGNDKEWGLQRDLNYYFHKYYYGGIYPTILRLRDSISKQSPIKLLPLNILTLSEFSSKEIDHNLIQDNYNDFLNLGVPKNILDKSIENMIKKGITKA